ncbi:hypothetical protein PILCRDRAFT_828731 [Piloderma croceum F 1598]|uniref:Uncharacterized protein n=1 Tax=Piloderma croceum (strain F 1598) TaxID=765440 RepID=A0A0C3F1J8_PILCF|nr:hypothetical protein PILCRDRAFT_828731 [Piloderma croceum F 1598]
MDKRAVATSGRASEVRAVPQCYRKSWDSRWRGGGGGISKMLGCREPVKSFLYQY